MKTAAIYCRVSTDNQEREGTSLQTQLDAILNYCQEKGYDVRHRFSETKSGLTLDRPKLDELRDLARNEQIDVLVVYSLDRLSRNPNHGVIILNDLEKHKVTLEAVSETVDSSRVGKLMIYIRQWAAEQEIEDFKDRSRRGKKAMVQEGKYPQGLGLGIYGYDWDTTTKKHQPNEYEAPIVNKIFTMISEGCTRMDIARTLNEQGIRTKGGKGRSWHRATIERIITNKAYIGITTYCGTELPEVTPPIMDRELFDRANEVLKRTKELRKGRPKNPYLLTGHIVCGKCGKPLAGSCTRPPYRYYLCSETYRREHKPKTCNALRVRADVIESVIWGKLEDILKNPELIMQQIRELTASETDKLNGMALDKEIANLKRNIKGYGVDERSLLSLFRHKEIDRNALLDEINSLKNDRGNDEHKLAELKQSRDNMTNLVDAEIKISEYCSNVLRNLASFTHEDKRLALDALGVQVAATPGDYQITATLPIEINETSDRNVVANAHSYP
ncbi:MAG: recombinase family protein [Anaerolineales bacterium]|nr:recombinase family protein [Anaerolineales bacterium]